MYRLIYGHSLLAMGLEALVSISLHAQGSRVIQGFFSGSVDVHKKEKAAKSMKGSFSKVLLVAMFYW